VSETHFTLTNDEKNKIIKSYLKQESKMKVADNCAIGVGYNMCTDINFKAVDFFALIEPQIIEMEKKENKEIKAWVHP